VKKAPLLLARRIFHFSYSKIVCSSELLSLYLSYRAIGL
jgi:hypothetical protein